jgi:AAA15 family ATPase/GTPase
MYFEGSSGLSILPQILTTDVGYENKPYWNHYIANFKENIKDINLVLSNVQNHFNNIEIVLPHDNALYSLDAKYNVINDSEIKTYKLPFAKESMGTRKILLFASIFVLSLKNGSMLFVDEIDSVLHPDALRFFISAFKDPCINKKGAMLIFAAHNTKIIDFIDGENIVICNRNNTDFSSSIEVPYLYDDYDTKSLKKDIEDGRYGSVPIITKSLFIDELWKNEN